MEPVTAVVSGAATWLSAFAGKIFGAILGAILSILYIRPKTRGEAAERGCGSALFAIAFGDQVHHGLATFSLTAGFWQLGKPEHVFSAHVLAALLAWWLLSVMMATMDTVKTHIIDRSRDWLARWKTPPGP